MVNWSLTSHWDVTFFVDQDGDRNQRRYKALLEEQFRIAYISQGAIDFYEVGCMPTEDRKFIVDVIIDIKNQEKESIDKATQKVPNSPAPRTSSQPQKFSSLAKAHHKPNFPRR